MPVGILEGIIAIVTFLAAMSEKHKPIAIFGVLLLLFLLGGLTTLPPYIWVIIIVVMGLWIFKWK